LLLYGITIKGKCTKNTLYNRTSTINTHHYCSCSCPTYCTLQNLTSTINNHRYSSSYCPTLNNHPPLQAIWLSALHTQHFAMLIPSTVRVRDCSERSRSFTNSHVVRQRKCWYRVAVGMCEFKPHG